MNFQDVINIILPPCSDKNGYYRPSVTYSNGERQGFDAKRSGRRHGGVDFNYHYISGNPVGQSGINLYHPNVYSPVTGIITNIDKRNGMMEITDTKKYRHQIWHLNEEDSSFIKHNTYVAAGRFIGTMGGRGPDGASQFDQHVHYMIVTQADKTISNDTGTKINPEAFWSNQLYYTVMAGRLNHVPLIPAYHLDLSTRDLFNGLSQGLNVLSNGETLRRDGNHVWRIEPNGSTRGYFISE